jgi:hypothetical protein
MDTSLDDTVLDHRKYADDCIAMAQMADVDSDKVLWLAMAKSWILLADDVAHAATRGSDRDLEETGSSLDEAGSAPDELVSEQN